MTPKKKVELSPEQELALIKKTLQHPMKESIDYWLDTGNKLLNSVFGSEKKGIPYGKIIEVAGYESHGKTAQMYEIAGLAQRDGASVGIWDLELAWDPTWARKRGLDPDKVIVFQPVIGNFGTEKQKRMITAEEQCEEIELWMKRTYARNPTGRIFLGIDSIAAMVPKEAEEAGLEQNMRTRVSVASFLSWLLPRWQARASNYNAMMFLVNQIRVAPGKMFGNPEYTPGGNAVRFFCAIRVKMRRKGGAILKEGTPLGFKGVIKNWKNKSGEGSEEHKEIGFKMYYNGRSKYLPTSEIKSTKVGE